MSEKFDLNCEKKTVVGMPAIGSSFSSVPFSCTYLGLDFAFLEVPNGDSLLINESSRILDLRKHV